MRQAFQYATGADLDVASMGARHGKHIFRAASFGLTSQGRPINNTFAINLAIRKAAAAPGGGTVVIPEGIYPPPSHGGRGATARTETYFPRRPIRWQVRRTGVTRTSQTA